MMRSLKNPEDMLRFLFLWHGICGSKISCVVDISCDVGQFFFVFFVVSSHKDSKGQKVHRIWSGFLILWFRCPSGIEASLILRFFDMLHDLSHVFPYILQ